MDIDIALMKKCVNSLKEHNRRDAMGVFDGLVVRGGLYAITVKEELLLQITKKQSN